MISAAEWHGRARGADSNTPPSNCTGSPVQFAPPWEQKPDLQGDSTGSHPPKATAFEPLGCSLGGPWKYLTEADQDEGELAFAELAKSRIGPEQFESLALLPDDQVPIPRVQIQTFNKDTWQAKAGRLIKGSAVTGIRWKASSPLLRAQKKFEQELARARKNNHGILPASLTTTEIARQIAAGAERRLWQPELSSVGEDAGPRPLAAGVDTLWLSAGGVFRPEVIERLEHMKAQAETRPQVVMVGEHRLDVMPYGGKPCWAFILRGSTMTIRVRRKPQQGSPTVMAEFRSAYLWSRGPLEVTRDIEAILARWMSDPGSLSVSRIDLASDWAGLDISADDFLAGAWVTRSRSRSLHFKAGRETWEDVEARTDDASSSALHFHGQEFTGLVFGRGDISARVYRKDIEAKRSGKPWMRAIWDSTRSPASSLGPVWRVEFQIRGEALSSWVATRSKKSRGGKSWPHIWGSLDSIWGYLTGRQGRGDDAPRGWLTLRRRTDDATRSRWPMSSTWSQVSRLRWPGKSWHVRRIPAKRNARTPEWVSKIRRNPSARVDQAAAMAIVGREQTVRELATRPTRDLLRGEIFKCWRGAMAAYMTQAEFKAGQLAAQTVGTAISMTAAMDAAGNALDPPDERTALERIMITIREAVAREDDLVGRLIRARDKHLYHRAWDADLAQIGA